MAQFDFEELRRITRRAIGGSSSRAGAPADGVRFDRGLFDGPLEDHAWDALVEELRRYQDCRVRTARPSHRRFFGPFISFAKRAFFRLVRPIMHEAFETQAKFNETTFELLSHLVEERRRLRAESGGESTGERPR